MERLESVINAEITLDPYQVEGVKFGLSRPYCLIADEMGLGKTLQAITIALMTSKRILVVCPAFLKTNWRREFNKFSARSLDIVEFVGLKDALAFDPKMCFADVVLVTYDQVKYAEQVFAWTDCVIADECQKLKRITTQRTVFFSRYLYEYAVPRMILLSGTPMENRVEELYSPLVLLSFSPKAKNNFESLYPNPFVFCNAFAHKRESRIHGRRIIKWEGVKDVEGLKRLLHPHMIRRLAKDVLSLEDYTEEEVTVDYGHDAELEAEWKGFIEGRSIDSRAKRNSSMVKARCTAEMVKSMIEDEEPVVVFSDHPDAAKIIAARAGIPYIDGSLTPKKRDELVEKFQRGEVAGLSCTIGAASVGFNMTRASTLIFNDLSWIPETNAQALKRIHRRGQKNKCRIIYMVGSQQDAYIGKTLRKKINTINQVMN